MNVPFSRRFSSFFYGFLYVFQGIYDLYMGHLVTPATNSWGIPRFCSSARWSDVAPRGGSPVALRTQQMDRENDEFSWKNEEFIDNDEYMMIPY